MLDQLVAIHGTPDAIRCDNGQDSSPSRCAWAERHHVALHLIQPGELNQHAYLERFNRTFRRELLDAYLFASLAEVRGHRGDVPRKTWDSSKSAR